MSTALDRDALYYPYIHIRDTNWLKGTLLCFPQVRRMVPPDFYLNDSPEVQAFQKITGPRNEPLISEESTDQTVVEEAQHRLLKILEENEEQICNHYSLNIAIKQYDPQYIDSFQVHGGKMIGTLIEYLESKQLCWPARAVQGGYATWFSLHPKLGEALMSVIAINIAISKGLDIVTSSRHVHHALAALDENQVFQNLLRSPSPNKQSHDNGMVAEITDELALMVMTSHFNLDSLSPEQIGELIKEGKDLRNFRNALIPIAESIPDILDPAERQKRIADASKEVISNWDEYKKSLPRFALDALVDVSNIKIPEVISGIVAGATTGSQFTTGLGLTVGFVTYYGYRIFQKYREQKASPYQYLSKIEKAGASLITQPKLISRT